MDGLGWNDDFIYTCRACMAGSNDIYGNKCMRAGKCLQLEGDDQDREGIAWRTRTAHIKSAFICIGSLPPHAT